MKLKNKLLPIIVLSGITTIAIPLVTSCANKNDADWIDATKEVDTSNFKKHADGSIPLSQVKIDYLDALEDDPTIFTNDFMFSQHENIKGYIGEGESRVNVGKYKISNVSFNKTNKTISYDISAHFDILMDMRETNDSFDWGRIYVEDTISYVDMPFEFVHSSPSDAINATGSAYHFDVMGYGMSEDSYMIVKGKSTYEAQRTGSEEWQTVLEAEFEQPTTINKENIAEYGEKLVFIDGFNGCWMSYYVYDNEIVEE